MQKVIKMCPEMKKYSIMEKRKLAIHIDQPVIEIPNL